MTNFCNEYRLQLTRTIAVLDSVANADHDVELSLAVFYSIKKISEELESFLSDQGIDPDERTLSALAGLRLFCRSVGLLLDMGLDNHDLKEKVDPSCEIRLFCELCADAMRQALVEDGQALKKAA